MLQWKKGDGRYEVRGIDLASDGGLLLTGEHRRFDDDPPLMFVLRTEPDGNLSWDKWLAQPDVVYSGVSMLPVQDGSILALATRTWGHHQDIDAISLLKLAPRHRSDAEVGIH